MSAHTWQKSSYSAQGANCFCVAVTDQPHERQTGGWQKSSYSAQGATCFYVAAQSDRTILLRESDDPHVIVTTTQGAFRGLVRTTKSGAHDHSHH
ncbi:DUF397 domain-containing protein [Streptomyces sp. NPDC003077]|uniref:DUF397 domain-containing protein n=1 Tax=Streptomyces sp. NPDC003077 TaxID=3154443 RepID=UPI0033A9CE4F